MNNAIVFLSLLKKIKIKHLNDLTMVGVVKLNVKPNGWKIYYENRIGLCNGFKVLVYEPRKGSFYGC